MDFDVIKRYTHKIKKINVKNTNRYSLRSRIVLKVHMEIKDTETVRFSLKENSDYIGHQQQGNDFFMRVPNNLVGIDGKPTITTIYAHFFDKDLYQYKKHQQIFSEFDLSTLETTDMHNYQVMTDYINKTVSVASLLDNSIDDIKNPNYKEYIENNIGDNIVQGYFPISSRYRSSEVYHKAPYLLNKGPMEWFASEIQTTYWEAKVHRSKLSPLISDEVENTDEDTPLNVFLNYEYLPTSTEYHQHLFGFEDSLGYKSKSYNVLEGENLDIVSDKFKNHNNYRIVQLSNIYNADYSMYVPKDNNISINLDTFITQYCELKYNQCHKYYTYIPRDQPNFAEKLIQLQEGKVYTLKYYIYIPDTMLDTEDVYIGVNDEKIPLEFRKQDKILRNRWIYHEVPFISKGSDNIYIHGPQQVRENNVCHLFYISIDKMKEYSPTIKYNQRGIQLLEEDNYITRPIYNTIDPEDTSSNTYSKQYDIVYWPTVETKVNFIFNRTKDVFYDTFKKSLYFTHDDEDDFEISYDTSTGELRITPDEDIRLYMGENKNLMIEYKTDLTFTKGLGNHFEVELKDINDNPVYTGSVEAAIHDNKIDEKDDLSDCVKYLGFRDVHGSMIEFNNIDLSNLTLDDDEDTVYYLGLRYVSPCNESTFICEPVIVQSTKYFFKVMSRDVPIDISETFIINDNEQLPLQLQLEVKNQLGNTISGMYIDLSIDDKKTQSTIVDSNGVADFYLDLDDLKFGEQVIKFEYFNKNYHPIDYVYFNLNNFIKSKPTLPFIVKGIIQEDKELPIDIEEFEQELQTITDVQTYNFNWNPAFFIIDIDIPSGVMNESITLEIYRDDNLVNTFVLDSLPTEPLVFLDDFSDLDLDYIEWQPREQESKEVEYKFVLQENNNYRENDATINISHL